MVIPSKYTVYPKKYAHGFCFAVLCCDYTLTDFPISIRLTSLALWQSNDCPSASKATLMNMDKYFMWIHYEWLHSHNRAKHNKTVCIFLGIYCMQYNPYHMHRVLLCFALVWSYGLSLWIHEILLPIYFKVSLLAAIQLHQCHWGHPIEYGTKCKWCEHFLGCTS